MNNSWKKALNITGWLSLTVAGIVLLIAAVQKKNLKKCTDVKIELNALTKHVFMEEKEILRVLNTTGSLIGQPVESINLQVLEKRLEKDKWIKKAELFFDNNQVLQVKVEERIPIARIFTIAGNSFYIDSAGKQLPLSDISIRVPMFTSFPAIGNKLTKTDSVLMASIKDIAIYINNDEFWKAQVAQVDITPQRTFEIIPSVGNHIVRLGKGTGVEEKLNRLYSFYRQVWTKVGLEKYSSIDVQFKGQVIATRKGTWTTTVDSAKVKEAFESMLASNKPDTIDMKNAARSAIVKEKIIDTKEVKKEEQKNVISAKEVNEAVIKKNNAKEAKKPKAVMLKKEE